MELAQRSPARTLLKLGTGAFIPVYVFVVCVAFVTTGRPMNGALAAAYACVVPPAYAAACALWAFGPWERRLSRPVVWALHIAALPALYVSLLGLGLLLPLFAALWWTAAGRPALLG